MDQQSPLPPEWKLKNVVRLDDGHGQSANKIPHALSCSQIVLAKDKHAEEKEPEDDREGGPDLDGEGAVRERHGAHGAKVKGIRRKAKGKLVRGIKADIRYPIPVH